MPQYSVFSENKYDRHCGFYTTYGLIATENGAPVGRMSDISVVRDKVERMAVIFTQEGLDPVHLHTAVEDYLYDFEIGS